MTSPISYEVALNEVLHGCFPENEHITGASPEYTRGVLNALAEMFAVPGVFTDDRMLDVLADLTHLAAARNA